MNRVSVWIIRASLVWFLLAVFSGGCLLLSDAGWIEISIQKWLGAHVTMAVMGWMAGIVAGTGLWMLPRWIRSTGAHVRLDRWWHVGLTQAGVLVTTSLWIAGMNPLPGLLLWVAGMGSLVPVFWLRSRPVPKLRGAP